MSNFRLERQKTGGFIDKSIPLNEIENKVKEMIQLSVDGMPSTFDCDTELITECDSEIDDITGNLILFYNSLLACRVFSSSLTHPVFLDVDFDSNYVTGMMKLLIIIITI